MGSLRGLWNSVITNVLGQSVGYWGIRQAERRSFQIVLSSSPTAPHRFLAAFPLGFFLGSVG